MKTQNLRSIAPALNLVLIVLMLTLLISGRSEATIHNVTVANFAFTPANITATVGDTVKWTRTGGSHTTTCNGTKGSTRPEGAAAWNSDLDANNPTFTYIISVAGTYHYICIPHQPDMSGNIDAQPSSITQLTEIVRGFELSQNYPNPFNPVTNIEFSVPNSSNVSLKIYNNLGREVETLINENLNAGTYRVDWNAGNFTSGIYYYTIKTPDFTLTKKMMLIK